MMGLVEGDVTLLVGVKECEVFYLQYVSLVCWCGVVTFLGVLANPPGNRPLPRQPTDQVITD